MDKSTLKGITKSCLLFTRVQLEPIDTQNEAPISHKGICHNLSTYTKKLKKLQNS